MALGGGTPALPAPKSKAKVNATAAALKDSSDKEDASGDEDDSDTEEDSDEEDDSEEDDKKDEAEDPVKIIHRLAAKMSGAEKKQAIALLKSQ